VSNKHGKISARVTLKEHPMYCCYYHHDFSINSHVPAEPGYPVAPSFSSSTCCGKSLRRQVSQVFTVRMSFLWPHQDVNISRDSNCFILRPHITEHDILSTTGCFSQHVPWIVRKTPICILVPNRDKEQRKQNLVSCNNNTECQSSGNPRQNLSTTYDENPKSTTEIIHVHSNLCNKNTYTKDEFM